MKILLSLSFLLSFSILNAQCNPSALIIEQTRAKDTDSNIDWEINKHYSFYNPDCLQRNVLVIHLVGSYDNPSSNLILPSHAANNGFHVISLKYPNSVAAQTSCAISIDDYCYSNFRKEIIEGGDFHTDVNVDVSNAIYNRLIKLLQYLNNSNPSQGWNQYYSTNTITWSKIIISGHSQGGGHAAYIAKNNTVKRVLMFASPNDYSTNFNAPANWTTQAHQTADSLYFGFNNLHDDVVDFSDQFEIWNALGMQSQGDSLCVNTNNNYQTSKQLYTTTIGSNANQNHSLMIRDDQLILDNYGNSIFVDVWDYMLGITTGLEVKESIKQSNFNISPNPVKDILHCNIIGNCTISIYNINGVKQSFHLINTTDIDVSDFSRGIYFINIQNKNTTAKFVKD